MKTRHKIKFFLLLLFVLCLFSFRTSIATELTDAVRNNDLNKIKKLIANDVDVNEKDKEGFTPLIIASGIGDKEAVGLLLMAGADVNILDNRMGASALHKVAQSGIIDIAKMLLEHGAFINLQSPQNGHTPLIDAVWHEREKLIKFLLEQGANADIAGTDNFKAIDWANRGNHPEKITAILKEYEIKKSKKLTSLKLLEAVREDDLVKVRYLISKGEDVNERSSDGLTPLLLASRSGKDEILKVLLEHGANVNIIDYFMKSTPAHKAGYMGHDKTLKLLIDYGVKINEQGPYNGYTALHDAIWHRHKEAVKVLLDANANLELKNHNGKTPLELARELGFNEIVKMIEEKLDSY